MLCELRATNLLKRYPGHTWLLPWARTCDSPALRAGLSLGVNCSARSGTAVDGQGAIRLKVPPKALTPLPLPTVPVCNGPEVPTSGCSWL